MKSDAYDLVDFTTDPVTVQRFRRTADGDDVPVSEARPIRFLERLWWYHSRWKPWCWYRVLRARIWGMAK